MVFAKFVLPFTVAAPATVASTSIASVKQKEIKTTSSKKNQRFETRTNRRVSKRNASYAGNRDNHEGLKLSRPTLKNVFDAQGYKPITDYANVYMSKLSGNREVAFKNVLFGDGRFSKSQIQLFEEGCKSWSERFVTDSKFNRSSYHWMKNFIKNYCFVKK